MKVLVIIYSALQLGNFSWIFTNQIKNKKIKKLKINLEDTILQNMGKLSLIVSWDFHIHHSVKDKETQSEIKQDPQSTGGFTSNYFSQQQNIDFSFAWSPLQNVIDKRKSCHLECALSGALFPVSFMMICTFIKARMQKWFSSLNHIAPSMKICSARENRFACYKAQSFWRSCLNSVV